uniref:Tetratricopeptide repeat protein n=1 Tax=Eiseniibacteriota bacterium TaxID=2212470 RepID=A0A832MKY6_UNCEI
MTRGAGAGRDRARRPAGAPRPARARGPAARAAWGAALLAAALAFVVHLPSLANGYVRDDADLIERNRALREAPLVRLALADYWASRGGASGYWRPAPLLSFAAEARLGAGAAVRHAVNVVLHAVATAVLAALLVGAGLPFAAALAGAAWFAVMPAHAEAVAWLVGRTDLLCALGALAALALDARERAAGRRWPGPAPLAALALALLSKEAAAPLALVLAAAAWADGAGARDVARRASPYLLLTLAWLAAHRALAASGGSGPVYLDPARRDDWPWAAWTLVPAAAALLVPGVPIAPDQLPPLPRGPLDAAAVAGFAATAAAVAALAWLAARRSPALAPAALALAPLLPPVAAAALGAALPFGPRVVYLPSAGAAWLAALALARAEAAGARSRAAGRAAAAALVAASAAGSIALQPAWRDEERHWRAMVAAQPSNPAGWTGLADVRSQRGARAEAESLLARAESLAPALPAAALARAALHHRHGEWEPSAAAAERVLAWDPRHREARWLRGVARLRLRRLAEARADAETLLAGWPDDPRALGLLGQARLLGGDPAGARAALEAAARGAPDDPAVWFALGGARVLSGDPAGGALAFERVLAGDPRYYDGWLQLALARAEAGDAAGARAAVARAAALPEAADGRAAELARALAATRLPAGGASRTVRP